MASVMEIVSGLSNAISNTHDGALDENGDPIKFGLRREKEVPITDKRVMDGFSIRLEGNKMCVYYNGEVTMKEVQDRGFEDEIKSIVFEVVKHIKKQFKSYVGEALQLKEDGEFVAEVQNMSRVRSWVTAKQLFSVGNYGDTVQPVVLEEETFEQRIGKEIRDALRMDSDVGTGAKKNRADTRSDADKKAPDTNFAIEYKDL
jgi:hypothetical protein